MDVSKAGPEVDKIIKLIDKSGTGEVDYSGNFKF